MPGAQVQSLVGELRSCKPRGAAKKRREKKKDHLAKMKLCTHACFGSTYTKIGMIQRRLAWPLRKDDAQIHEAFHIFKMIQTERYTMFLDWKNQHCENDYTTKSNLQIQCNPYQTKNGIFTELQQKISEFVWKHKRLRIAKATLRK